MSNIVAWSAAKRGRRLLSTALTVWFALAVIASLTGALLGRPPQLIVGAVVALTLGCLFAAWKISSVHAWAKHTSFRVLVGTHITRFVGVGFLVYHARGELPGSLALAAGWGDIVVAIAAVAVVIFVLPIETWRDWWIVLAWNVFGLVDLLLVVSNAARLGLSDPSQIAPMFVFPMSLLPTFLVPLLLTTHGLIFWRLWRTRRRLRNDVSRPSTSAPISALHL